MKETIALFVQAGHNVRRRIEAARVPLTFAQYEALRHTTSHDCMSMQELAQELRITAPSATGLVDELVRGGYLRRTHNPGDRRQVLLVPTSSAKRALQKTAAIRTRVLRGVLAKLSARDHRDLRRIFSLILASTR